jgi:hypothetical protein
VHVVSRVSTDRKGVRLVSVASYVESGILTWGVPLLVLIAVCAYWAFVARRHGEP